MNRRAFLKAGTGTVALCLSGRAWCGASEQSKEAEILSQCKERIDQHRRRAGVIVVRDAAGQPIPGAKVKVEQLRHEFLFGSNFFQFDRCGSPDLESAYRERFAAVLNYCTLGFYWAGYEVERGHPDYAYTDRVLEWTREHGLLCKGHPLVWDHPASSPKWLPDDPAEIERLSAARVREIVSRFKGRLEIWDVVNEPTHLPQRVNQSKMADWARSLGPVPYVAKHLRIARAANPNATLLVNDYRIEPAYLKILQALRQDDGVLFDAVGIQSHMHDGMWPLQKVWSICDTYSTLGLPIHFTETTLLSGTGRGPDKAWLGTSPEGEARQAEQTANFYTAVFAHPATRALTWWDFTDRNAWQDAPAGWLRQDMSPKPMYERLLGLIKGEWWTRVEGTSDAAGEFSTRAFLGTHRITVELPGGRNLIQEVLWQREKPNRFELKTGA